MRKYWLAFAAVVVASFAVLGWTGVRIYQSAPPIPDRVVTTDGREIVGPGEITAGQNVWQALGGMQMGSVWGHGSYVAPDWTADWLHREALYVLNAWSREEHGRSWDDLDEERRAGLSRRLEGRMKHAGYDPATGTLTIEPVRAAAFEANASHYADVFTNGRDVYAIPKNALDDPAKARAMSAFFFWGAWAAVAHRPNEAVSYTNNWPHEPLVGNRPTGDTIVWTGVSILMLLAGLGVMATWHAVRRREDDEAVVQPPLTDPLLKAVATPSQRAVMKFFWLTAALFLVQILMGVVVAHYGVEGSAFYGIPLAKYLPYTVARTWHLQIGIFWIATAWLATGLYVGPAVGHEPRFQRLGVNVLFGALVFVAVGSLAGEWLSVKGYLGEAWFWFGHSGYEYIDLGRFWQIGLATGLVLWFVLVARAVLPALRRRDEQFPLLAMFLLSSGAIAGFYFAALGYGKHTNLAIAEYWRWWVVHLWVEGFFEVFATVVIAFLFARLGLVGMRSAGRSAVLSATIFLSGGIIGTLHHLYFSGTPTFVIGLGSVFSALEVVPLVFVGYEAWENLKVSKSQPWIKAYRWPIYFFVAVAFWNLVGAGLFGFMINPPIALYYMQGLNTTPVHAHTALFGVYGMLGIGLVLFCMRAMRPTAHWNERLLAIGFWSMNIGLTAMVVLSVFPIGLVQTWASVEHGYAYARSPELMQLPYMKTLRWMRVPGDTLFAVGALAIIAFVFGVGRRSQKTESATPPVLLADADAVPAAEE